MSCTLLNPTATSLEAAEDDASPELPLPVGVLVAPVAAGVTTLAAGKLLFSALVEDAVGSDESLSS